MSVLLRRSSLRRPQVVLGLAVLAVVFVPSASAATQLDSVTANGDAFPPGIIFRVNAQSDPSGQNASGQAFVHIGDFEGPDVSGPVTCLRVVENTAVINFDGTQSSQAFPNLPPVHLGIQTLALAVNGGIGRDTVAFSGLGAVPRAPDDCSPLTNAFFSGTTTGGTILIFDAPDLPTSKDQCKNGGWLNFPQFKNQGDCVSFVNNGR